MIILSGSVVDCVPHPRSSSMKLQQLGRSEHCYVVLQKGHVVVTCPGPLFVNGDRKGHKWPF